MLDRQIITPPDFTERSCTLVKYRFPLIRHCYILCHEPTLSSDLPDTNALLAFFFKRAEQLAAQDVGDPQAFLVAFSGATVRKRPNWHLHVFIVRTRWEKAVVYSILGLKSLLLAVYKLLGSR
jgi:hypothetical protein